jgi:hypothetical protein
MWQARRLLSSKAATPRIYLTQPHDDSDMWRVWDGTERFDFATEEDAMDFVRVQVSVQAVDGRVPKLHVEHCDGRWSVTTLKP